LKAALSITGISSGSEIIQAENTKIQVVLLVLLLVMLGVCRVPVQDTGSAIERLGLLCFHRRRLSMGVERTGVRVQRNAHAIHDLPFNSPRPHQA